MPTAEDLEHVASVAAGELRQLSSSLTTALSQIRTLQDELDALRAEVSSLKAELAARPPAPPRPPVQVSADIEVTLEGFGSFRPGLESDKRGREVRHAGELGNARVVLDLKDDGQIRVIVERCKPGLPVLAPAVNTRLGVKIGGGIRHDAPLRLHPHTRPPVVFNPSAPPSFDLAELVAARLVPNYDPSAKPSEEDLVELAAGQAPWTRWNGGGKPFDPVSESFSLVRDSWPPGAGQLMNEAAPLNPAEVAFLLSGDPRAWELVRRLADSSGCYPVHYYVPDDKGGHFPRAQETAGLPFLQGTNQVTIKTALGVVCPVPDTAHQHSLCYLGALLTGDRYWLEEVDAWRSYNLLARPPLDTRLVGIIHSGQERSTAWALRTLLLDALLDPASSAPAELRANLVYLNQTFVDPLSRFNRRTGVTSPQNFRPAPALQYVKPTAPMPPYIATWHYSVMAFVLDWCALAGFKEAEPVRDHILKVSEGVWKYSPTFWDWPNGNHAYPADDWAQVMVATFATRTAVPTGFAPHVTPDYIGWARFGPVVGARLNQPWAIEALKKIDAEAPKFKGGVPAVLMVNP